MFKWVEISFTESKGELGKIDANTNKTQKKEGKKVVVVNCDIKSTPLTNLEFLRKQFDDGQDSKMRLLYRRLTFSAGMGVLKWPFYAVIIMEHPLQYPKSTFYLDFIISSHVNESTRRL